MRSSLARGASGPVPRLRPVSGYVGVVDFLRREISLGRLLPGDKLPPERQLAEQLGVARETLRQALRVLEGSGQITITRGTAGGTVVQGRTPDADLILHELRARRDDLVDLVEYRAEIESAAARLAAARSGEDDIRTMLEAQEALAHASNKDESRRADTAFHLAVASASGNHHLAEAVEDARAAMFYPVDLLSFDFIRESSLQQHQAVLDAVAARDAAVAGTTMRTHIEHTRDEMERLIGA
jgi:GntR family transcriptional regulator, transcriptional repressor for pyruvate dehydrogenase complex